MTPQNQAQPALNAPKYATPAHRALADYLSMLNAIPDGATVTVIQASSQGSGGDPSLAAQLRQVMASQSYYQGG